MSDQGFSVRVGGEPAMHERILVKAAWLLSRTLPTDHRMTVLITLLAMTTEGLVRSDAEFEHLITVIGSALRAAHYWPRMRGDSHDD